MKSATMSIIKKSLYIFAVSLVICYTLKMFIFGVNTFFEYLDVVELAVTCAIPAILLYAGFLWRYNPFEKTPRIMGAYKGTVEFIYNNQAGSKETEVTIQQSLFGVKVKLKTNEILSDTITGNFVEENGEYVLYYIYITDPKSQYSENNPTYRGACRLIPSKITKKWWIQNVTELSGTYWTYRKRIGDIHLRKI